MAKVVFQYKGKEYGVNGPDIEKIIKHFDLDCELESEERRLSALGLMCLQYVSLFGRSAGDIPLELYLASCTEKQRELFRPAKKTIAGYFDVMRR